MDDGSLQKDRKTLIIHTQSYKENEVLLLSNELNEKFHLNSKVILHKKFYYVILIPRHNSALLRSIISPYIHSSMTHKLPRD